MRLSGLYRPSLRIRRRVLSATRRRDVEEVRAIDDPSKKKFYFNFFFQNINFP